MRVNVEHCLSPGGPLGPTGPNGPGGPIMPSLPAGPIKGIILLVVMKMRECQTNEKLAHPLVLNLLVFPGVLGTPQFHAHHFHPVDQVNLATCKAIKIQFYLRS